MIDLAYLTSLNIIEYHLYFAVFILGRKLQLSISFWSIVSLSFFRFSQLFREYCDERLYTFYPKFSASRRTRTLILGLDLDSHTYACLLADLGKALFAYSSSILLFCTIFLLRLFICGRKGMASKDFLRESSFLCSIFLQLLQRCSNTLPFSFDLLERPYFAVAEGKLTPFMPMSSFNSVFSVSEMHICSFIDAVFSLQNWSLWVFLGLGMRESARFLYQSI